MKKRWRIALLALVAFVLVGLLAARLYLSSGAAARRAAASLQDRLGLPVTVGSARIGLFGGSTLRCVTVLDADGGELLTVEEADLDASALSLMLGRSPRQVTLRGADVTLRFGRDDKLLTKLPAVKGGGAVPPVRIEGARFTLDQQGREPLVLHNVDAATASAGGELRIKGKVADERWGDWSVDLNHSSATGDITLNLQTAGVDVDQSMLDQLPFVPLSVWREVKARGHTPVKLTLRFNTATPGAHYRVELSPRDARVKVTAIDLEADRAEGDVVIEDGQVQLRGVKGSTAGGRIYTDADLDFRGKGSKLRFEVKLRGVVLHKLPRRWGVPAETVDGKLFGEADVTVVVRDGKAHTTGDGKGVVRNATVLGHKAKSVELRLVGGPRGLRFTPATPLIQSLPFLARKPDWRSILQEKKPRGKPGEPFWGMVHQGASLPGQLAEAIIAVGDAVGKALPRVARLEVPLPKRPEPTYLEATVTLEDVDLAQLVKNLKLRAPFPVAGKLDVRIKLGVPVDTPRDLKAYKLEGTARLPRLELAGQTLHSVTAHVRYNKGVLRLEELAGEVPHGLKDGKPGTFSGTARVDVIPQGDVRADLKVENVPLDVLLDRLPGAGGKARGDLSGKVHFRAPLAKVSDPASWKAVADLRSPAVVVWGLRLAAVAAQLTIDKGEAKLKGVKASLEGAPVTGSARAKLTGPYPFEASLALQGADLSASARLVPGLRPPFPVEGTASVTAKAAGALAPLKVKMAGDAKAERLRVDGVRADDLAFGWSLADEGLRLSGVKARLYQGEVTGSALLPARAAEKGQANLRLKDVDVQALVKGLAPRFPLRLEGRASGTVRGELSPAEGGQRTLSADVALGAANLRVQGIAARRLKGTLGYHKGALDYHLEGEGLGGRFKLEGQWPPAPKGKEVGRFSLERARVSELVRALGLRESLGPLRGSLGVTLTFEEDAGGKLGGRGRFLVRDLRWRQTELTDRIQGDILIGPERIAVREASGSVAGGELRVGLSYDPRGPGRAVYHASLAGADSGKLLGLVPGLEGTQGTLDVTVRGALNREIHGGGRVLLHRGKLAGVEVSEARLPFDFAYAPNSGRGELSARDGSALLGGGRATLRAHVAWDSDEGARVEGTLLLIEASVRALTAGQGDLSSYAQGRVTGRADFSGTGVRSLADLNANVHAKLHQTQAMQLPVLRQLTSFILPGQSTSTFQDGELRGRLSRGVFRVERLTLVGTFLEMFLRGNVTVPSGRLDLDVVARTGLVGVDPVLVAAFRLAALSAGPLPAATVLRLSGYLAPRTVHLRVGGTVRHPVVSVQPLGLLTEEVARFFLLRAVGL
jgi:hypothetical protein